MTSTLPRHATKPLPMPGFEETLYKGTESFNRFPALKDQLKSSPTQNQSTLPVLLTPSKQQPDRRYFVARLSHAATIEVDVLPFDDGFSDVSVERSMTSSGKDFLEALRKIVTSFALASVKAQVVGDQTRSLFLNAASQEGLISVLSGRWVVQELKASEAISSMFCKATASTATAKDEEKWFAK